MYIFFTVFLFLFYLFDREHMPGLFRKRVNLDTYELPTAPPPLGTGEDTISSLSESEEEIEADSVIQNMKDRRKASGQEIADIKLRTKLYGSGAIKDATSKKPFMDQFPYKSCQRGYQTARKRLPVRKKDDPGDAGDFFKKFNYRVSRFLLWFSKRV